MKGSVFLKESIQRKKLCISDCNAIIISQNLSLLSCFINLYDTKVPKNVCSHKHDDKVRQGGISHYCQMRTLVSWISTTFRYQYISKFLWLGYKIKGHNSMEGALTLSYQQICLDKPYIKCKEMFKYYVKVGEVEDNHKKSAKITSNTFLKWQS